MTGTDVLRATGLLFVAALLQVSLATPIEVGSGHPDLVLVLVVAIALLRGPVLGATAGFGAGLVADVAALQALGVSSLLLTLVGYWSGRFGEATSRSSPHPPLVAVGLATAALALGQAVLHFMLGETVAASAFFGQVLLPSVALNLLIAYPLYRLCRRLFPVVARPRRDPALV